MFFATEAKKLKMNDWLFNKFENTNEVASLLSFTLTLIGCSAKVIDYILKNNNLFGLIIRISCNRQSF